MKPKGKGDMRISFDLDETLFVNPRKSELEIDRGFLATLRFKERLRKGFPGLFADLKAKGHEVWVYTTSYRTTGYISRFFKRYGIRFDGIVNGQIHHEKVQAGKSVVQPSKYPPRFRIDLHVDDDKSVKANGDTLGFKVLILEESDANWTEKVVREVDRIRA